MRQLSTLPRPRLLLPLVAVLVTGCGDGGADPPASPTGPGSFPVTVGEAGSAVEIPARPVRIVSLSPTATEILFAIDAGDRVVAVDAESDYPAQAPVTELSGLEPNVEAVSAHEPDLVVAYTDPGGLVAGLDQIAVPALLHPPAATLADTYSQIEQLGAATGQVAEAAALVVEIEAEIAALVEEVPQRPEPLTYYHELDPTFYSVTSGTFIGQLYGLLGMRSIADAAGEGSDYPQLSAESILDADPDVILLADAECCGVDAAHIASRPGWDQLNAVRQGQIIALDEDVASRWGPRVVDLLRTLASELPPVA